MNRPSIIEQQEFVKESLFQFVRKHIPSAQLSCIDEIVLSYVVSILEDLGSETSVEEAFDVEGFCEMLEAYFPQFSAISHAAVCQWMFLLEETLRQNSKHAKDDSDICHLFRHDLSLAAAHPARSQSQSEYSASYNGQSDYSGRSHSQSEYPARYHGQSDYSGRSHSQSDHSAGCNGQSDYLSGYNGPSDYLARSHSQSDYSSRSYSQSESSNDAPPANAHPRVHQLSETSDGSSDSGGDYSGQDDTPYFASQVTLLQEMFPLSCTLEVRHCLSIAEGDVGRAVQLVLHRQEAGQSLTAPALGQGAALAGQKAVANDQELKTRIINRYSYVDKDDDVREHRPVGPKVVPKKLVRYRDNKIVSLKGERFTDIKKDEEEDMKKTYVSIKPAKQYRFH